VKLYVRWPVDLQLCFSAYQSSYLKSFHSFALCLQRRVQHVAKENEFYMQLINLALPPETNNHSEAPERPSRGRDCKIHV